MLATVLLRLTSEYCKDVAAIWYNPIALRLRQRKSRPCSATVSGWTDAAKVATMVHISLATAFQMDESIIVGLGSVPLQHNALVCLIMINVSPWLGIRKYLGTIIQSAHHHLTSIKALNVVFPTKRQDSPSIPFTLSSFPLFHLYLKLSDFSLNDSHEISCLKCPFLGPTSRDILHQKDSVSRIVSRGNATGISTFLEEMP